MSTLLKSDQNLIWLHAHMTGLDPETECLLEVAVIVTGPDLQPRIEGPALAIHQSDVRLTQMDAWNKATHGKSGLIGRVRDSPLAEQEVENAMLDFVKRYVPEGASPMCGNVVGHDRRFLLKYMPWFESHFHESNIELGTFNELCRRWRPAVHAATPRLRGHTALAQVHDYIDQLVHYRTNFLRV